MHCTVVLVDAIKKGLTQDTIDTIEKRTQCHNRHNDTLTILSQYCVTTQSMVYAPAFTVLTRKENRKTVLELTYGPDFLIDRSLCM